MKETSFVGEINATIQRITDVVEEIRPIAMHGKDAVKGKPTFQPMIPVAMGTLFQKTPAVATPLLTLIHKAAVME